MKGKVNIAVLLACVLALAVGLGELFKLRFETGDVYPAYSSLRTDPLGTSAYYESLERVSGVGVSRDFSATDQLPEGRGSVYLHLAGERWEWEKVPEETFRKLEGFLRDGGRLVVAFYPEYVTNRFRFHPDTSEGNTNAQPPTAKSSPKRVSGTNELEFRSVSLAERWGVTFRQWELQESATGDYAPVKVINASEAQLPGTMMWHSGLVFTNLDPAWRVIYSRRSAPVLIERRIGSGSVIFATDCYFVSNEALAKERYADLLAWLVGGRPHVVFDEAHFGIIEEPGIAMLMRKYRLEGLAVALMVLAGLFIWKSAAPLLPKSAESSNEAYVMGKDSAAGFISLLRRHIPTGEIFSVCLAEWRKSRLSARYSAARVARAEAVIDAEQAKPASRRDPVSAFRAISRALHERAGTQPVSDGEKAPQAGVGN